MARLHAVIDVPADQHATAESFWGRVLGWRAGAPWPGHPELSSFEPPDGTSYVHLQRIDGPGRVHLDVEAEQPHVMVSRAVDLGAVSVAERDRWHTLRSPGGLPFCVVGAGEGVPAEPLTWPDGHRSRMVQVCIDSPARAHDGEVAFWRDLLPWRWEASDDPEFAGKLKPGNGSPLQLLFQRVDEPEGPVRAHLDHGTDDLPLEVARLLALGATDVAPGRGWHVFRDPTGQLFCATENSPDAAPRTPGRP